LGVSYISWANTLSSHSFTIPTFVTVSTFFLSTGTIPPGQNPNLPTAQPTNFPPQQFPPQPLPPQPLPPQFPPQQFPPFGADQNGTLTLTLAIPLPSGPPAIIGSNFNGQNNSNSSEDGGLFGNGAVHIGDGSNAAAGIMLAGLVALGGLLL
jgi:hypothetical protein